MKEEIIFTKKKENIEPVYVSEDLSLHKTSEEAYQHDIKTREESMLDETKTKLKKVQLKG